MRARVEEQLRTNEAGDLAPTEVRFLDLYYDPACQETIPVIAAQAGLKKTTATKLVGNRTKLEIYMALLERRRSQDPGDRERWAISRLLEGAPLDDVVNETGVHRTTLTRWMAKDAWRPLLMEARVGAEMHAAVVRLRAGEDAIGILTDLARTGRSEGARVAAGEALLKIGFSGDGLANLEMGPSRKEIAAYLQMVVSWVVELTTNEKIPRERIPDMLLDRIAGSVETA